MSDQQFILERDTAPRTVLRWKAPTPQVFLPICFPTIDILGTREISRAFGDTKTNVATTSINADTVPLDKLWYVFGAAAEHDDALNSLTGYFSVILIGEGASTRVYLTEPKTVAQNLPVVLPRPIIIPGGSNLRHHWASIGPGVTTTLRYWYREVAIGEVIHWP